MQWRDSFYARIEDSNGSSCFSYVGDMNAYLNIDNRNKNDISFGAHEAYK